MIILKVLDYTLSVRSIAVMVLQGIVTEVGHPSPGCYGVKLDSGETLLVHHRDLDVHVPQYHDQRPRVQTEKQFPDEKSSKKASRKAKNMKNHSPEVNAGASSSTCPPDPKILLG